MFNKEKTLWAALVLALGVQSCSDSVCGQIDIDLTVQVQDRDAKAVANAEVFLVHHKYRGGRSAVFRETRVCKTPTSGICSAKVRYQYSEVRSFWQDMESSRDRFELRAIRNGEVRSLGFLQELTPAQIQGYEEVKILVVNG